jgi:hypothetical protein
MAETVERSHERGELRGGDDEPEDVTANLRNREPFELGSQPKLQHLKD